MGDEGTTTEGAREREEKVLTQCDFHHFPNFNLEKKVFLRPHGLDAVVAIT